MRVLTQTGIDSYIGIVLIYNINNMLEFQERKRIRQIFYSRPTLIILVLLFVISSSSAYKMYEKARDTGNNLDKALKEQESLKMKEMELNGHLGQLKTESGVEKEIRKKFRVVKAGEGVIIVVGDKTNEAAVTESEPAFRPLFERIKSWFTQ